MKRLATEKLIQWIQSKHRKALIVWSARQEGKTYQSGINATSFLSSNRENTLSGIFFESFVAFKLVVKGHNLFYWKETASAELSFIILGTTNCTPST